MDSPLFEVDQKVCCTCKELKPLTDFNKRKTAKDGRQWSCRECNKAYHYANWDRHMVQIRARSKERIARNQRFVIEYLRTHPCVDCGESDLVVLEFDHLRDQVSGISRMIRNSELARIIDEIAKCDVVCANCHRRRTAQRGGWYRLRA